MRRTVLLLAALSLILRLALAWQAGRLEMPPRAWERGHEVGAVARALATGRGFADPFGEPTGATAAVGPAVPALWALSLRAFGVDSSVAWMLIVLLDCLALAAVVPAIFALGRRVKGERFGMACAIAWSLHPVGLMVTRGYLSSLAWFTLALVVVVERMLAVEEVGASRGGGTSSRPRGPWMSLGLALGASAWIEPLLGPCVLAWTAFAVVARRPHARDAVLATIVAALCVTPWIVRNAVVVGAPSLRAAAGPEIWRGALAGPGEESPMRVHPSRNRMELEHLRAVGELQFNREKLALARELVAADPARWAASCAWRLGNYWLGRASWWRATETHPLVQGRLSAMRGFLHASLALLAVAGLASAWHGVRSTRLLALVLAVYPIPYALTHVEARYRLPLEPLLALAACLLLLRIPAARGLLAGGADRAHDARSARGA